MTPTVLQSPADVAALIDGGAALTPFAEDTLAVLAEASRRLLNDAEARLHPDLQALGFWLRPAGLVRLRESFAALERPDRLVVPRGVAFHVPPANVGTLFAYGWALSLLAGNRNVVRLPTRSAPEQVVLLRLLGEALEAVGTSATRAASCFVRYGHDDAISGALSRAADVRVIWGGDATVAHFRALPVNPRCLDVAFPDRFSWAVLDARAVLATDDAALVKLAEGLGRDLFWFGQKACSSPRLIVWCGSPEDCAAAAARLYPRLGREGGRMIDVDDIGGALARRLFLHQAALDLPVTAVEDHGALSVLRLAADTGAGALKGPHAGGGVLYEMRLPSLIDACAVVSGRDQTVVHYGFPMAALESFARTVNGRGVDRIVPVGSALAFDAVWDGLDLLAAFTKVVTLRG